MSRACKTLTEPYEPKKLDIIYNNIVSKALSEKPQFFEIRIDGFTVVEKTSDPERFFDYSEFMESSSKEMSILLYYGAKNASDKYYFTLNGNSSHQINTQNSLNGFESKLENEESTKERWRRDLHYEDLIEENDTLKEEIAELRQSLEMAEQEKDNILNNRDLGLQNIASVALNGLFNTEFAKEKLGFLSGLSGAPNPNATQQQPETENTFKRKGNSNENEDVVDAESEEIPVTKLSKEEREYVNILQTIKTRVGLIEVKNVFHLLDLVTLNPKALHFGIKQITNYIKQNSAYESCENSHNQNNPTNQNPHQSTNTLDIDEKDEFEN